MQFSTAKTEVAERLHDTASANETRVGEWLNLVMHEICSMSDDWDWLQAIADLAIVAGDQDYTISSAVNSACRNIVDIRIETDGGWILLPMNQRTADDFYADPDLYTGRPESYSVWAGVLNIYPDPDDNYTAKVRYIKTVSDLSAAGDTPPWPRYWDHVWLAGAEALGLRFEQLPRAEQVRREYEQGLRKMLGGKAIALNQALQMRGWSSGRSARRGSPWPIERFD